MAAGSNPNITWETENRDFRYDPPLTPAKAIRKRCLGCVGEMPSEVRGCTARVPLPDLSADPKGCHLWPYRMGKKCDRSQNPNPPTRTKAIRLECLNCMGGKAALVKTCESSRCPLWPYRLGHGICTDPAGEVVRSRRPNQKDNGSGLQNLLRGRERSAEEEKADQTDGPGAPGQDLDLGGVDDVAAIEVGCLPPG